MPPLCFNHSLTPHLSSSASFFFLNAPFFISIALLSQPRLSIGAGVAPLIFHSPFISAIRPFPKSTLRQQGEAFSHWLLPCSNFFLFGFSLDFSHFFFMSFHLIILGLFVPSPTCLVTFPLCFCSCRLWTGFSFLPLTFHRNDDLTQFKTWTSVPPCRWLDLRGKDHHSPSSPYLFSGDLWLEGRAIFYTSANGNCVF